MTEQQQIHASCVVLDGRGILLRGASGVGKSSLALHLIEGGAKLVADDRTDLTSVDGEITASAPNEISGLIEARGLGVLRLDPAPTAPVRLIVDLVSDVADVPRLPETRHINFMGVRVRHMTAFSQASVAPTLIRLALELNDDRWVEPT